MLALLYGASGFLQMSIEWRHYQKPVVERIIRDLETGKKVFLDSPTGSGKTLMILYAALTVAERRGLRVVTSVRTRTQMNMYLYTLKKWFKDKTFTILVAKKDSCPLHAGKYDVESTDIDCTRCPLKNKKSVQKIRVELLETNDVMKAITRLNNSIPPICTYYSLRASIDYSDVIIVSYPYVFDPSVREPTIADILPDSILVVDEAHNIDRIPDMYEKKLTRGILEQALKQVKKYVSETMRDNILGLLEKIRDRILEVVEVAESDRLEKIDLRLDLDEDSIELIGEAAGEVSYRLSLEDIVEANWVKRVYDFLVHYQRQGFRVYRYVSPYGKVVVVKPVEPGLLAGIVNTAWNVVLMSGTLPDVEYIRSSWGVEGEYDYIDVEGEYGPVFPHSRRTWIIVWDVTSKWEKRGPEMTYRYSLIVRRVYGHSRKSVLVIATSYNEANLLYKYLADLPVFVEKRDTILEDARRHVLENKHSIVLAVASGKLSEGVELVDEDGSSLIDSVVVAGIPYPQPDDYVRERVSLLARRMGVSYFQALMMVAAITIRQSIGRAVRRDGDNAVFVLADKRYRDRKWLKLLKIDRGRLYYSTTSMLDRFLKGFRSNTF